MPPADRTSPAAERRESEQPASEQPASEHRGVQLAVAAYVMWGALTVYWKQLSDFSPFELIVWRMACAALVMAVVVTVRRTWNAIVAALRTPRTLARVTVAGVLLTANWGAYVHAVTSDQVIETALGYFIAPLVTMTIGVVVLGEHPTAAQRLAFASAAVAVVILTVSYGEPPWIALIIAATWGLYGLSTRRITLGPVEGLAAETFVLFVPAVIGIAVWSQHADSVVNTASGWEWPLVFGTGIVTAVPLTLFAAAAKTVPFTILGPLNLLVPVINFGLGWLVYDEPMPADRLVGFAFVWLALGIVTWDQLARTRRAPSVAPAQ